jgi:hypothetical protein
MVLHVLWLGAALFGLARLYRKWESPAATRITAVVLIALLCFAALQFQRSVSSPVTLAAMNPLLRRLLKYGLLGVAAVAAAGACYLFVKRPAVLLRAAANVPLVLFPFFPLLLLQAGWSAFHAEAAATVVPRAARPTTTSGPRSRTVILLFDELDYRIAFDERPAGLSLPEFDRFRREAWWADQAFPAAGNTLHSIPGLLSGRRATTVTKAGASELRIRFRGSQAPVSWRDTPTLFTDARERGERTAAAGWYHPYPRVLGHDLDDATWETFYYWHDRPARPMPEIMLHQAALAQILGPQAGPSLFGKHHTRSYERLLAAATRLTTDPELDLVYVHFPVPHLPGIYDRSGKRLAVRRPWDLEAYLGNLALCDQALGEVRSAMTRAGTWERSTVIVTSDHWLREIGLSPKAEYRVPYGVKLPGRHAGVQYGPRFNTVLTRDLLRQQASGRITDPESLGRWVETRRQDTDQR